MVSQDHELPDDAYAKPKGIDWLANRLLRTFYRKLEVVGAEKIPRDHPVVLVGNHVNGLLDPALLIGFLPVKPRFLAKSTLWNTVVRPFLNMAAAIPVYRRQDPGVDTEQNAETFRRCHEVLAAGGAIALFPEGTSHNEPALVPLKTGVSRIVLQAEERFGTPGDPLGTRIVPVGLTFDDKGRFRSRVLIHVGDPIDPSPEVARFANEPRAAVRALTDRVRAALEDVTLNYDSWREAELISRAAEIWARPEQGALRELPLEESFNLRKVFADGYEGLLERVPARVHAVAERVSDYDRQLALYGLTDGQVASRYPRSQVIGFVLESLALLLLRFPLGAFGTLMNFLPYQAVGRFASWKSPSPDVDATYKLLASLVFFPLTWLAWSAAAFVAARATVGDAWLWAVAFLLLGPFTGYFALRLHQRRDLFWRQTRAFLRLRIGGRGVDEVRCLRRRVRKAVSELADEWNGARGRS
ncbi:MAG: lysophospholipid acyltransferase family protein [Thermoanaerobaculia bacterium]|nr:lysophospholipid acyltransferase family protein [Thermoanaerobaculia bacterium]